MKSLTIYSLAAIILCACLTQVQSADTTTVAPATTTVAPVDTTTAAAGVTTATSSTTRRRKIFFIKNFQYKNVRRIRRKFKKPVKKAGGNAQIQVYTLNGANQGGGLLSVLGNAGRPAQVVPIVIQQG